MAIGDYVLDVSAIADLFTGDVLSRNKGVLGKVCFILITSLKVRVEQ